MQQFCPRGRADHRRDGAAVHFRAGGFDRRRHSWLVRSGLPSERQCNSDTRSHGAGHPNAWRTNLAAGTRHLRSEEAAHHRTGRVSESPVSMWAMRLADRRGPRCSCRPNGRQRAAWLDDFGGWQCADRPDAGSWSQRHSCGTPDGLRHGRCIDQWSASRPGTGRG